MHCCFCPQSLENEWHVFIDCDKAKEIWKATNFWHHIQPTLDTTEGFNQLQSHEQHQLAVILWIIWRNRNNKIWNNAEPNANISVSQGLQFSVEWLSVRANQHQQIHHSSHQITSWIPPAAGFFKCNFDVAIFKEENTFGIGLCLRGADGTFVKAYSEFHQGIPRPEEAEAFALHKALQWAAHQYQW